MSQLTMIYETNAHTGLPALRLVEGPAGAISNAEVRELERELQARYEELRREPASTVCVRTRQYAVENPDPNGSRQPTLIIRPAAANGAVAVSSNGKTRPPRWEEGFYGELARMVADPAIQRLEAHALRAAVEELQGGAAESRGVLAATLMAGYLALSEQVCRGQDQDRAGMYALALRGLGRLVPESDGEEGLGWRRSSAVERTEVEADMAKPPWLRRILARIISLPAGTNA
jgi:hypothetical protein